MYTKILVLDHDPAGLRQSFGHIQILLAVFGRGR